MPHIIRVDFVRSIRKIFFRSIEKAISKYLNCLNDIDIEKYEYKIVIELGTLNLPILR